MALSREQIVDTAHAILREHGLAALSMRRLAQNLDVQPGALYYHVPNKQELLVAVAARVVGPVEPVGAADAREVACALRAALLTVRDGAEVVSFAHAFRPGRLTALAELHQAFAGRFPPREARWAGRTLVHYVLGFVAEEQNRAELMRAGELSDPDNPDEAFRFGVDAVLRGLDGPCCEIE